MLRLWPSTRVLVLADRILAEQLSAGLHPQRKVAQLALSGSERSPLSTAIQALLAQLPTSRWQRLTVYVADQHVHMMLLPEPQMMLSASDQQAYAAAMLMQTYGDEARSWPFRMQDHRLPAPSLLAAIPMLAEDTLYDVQAQPPFGQSAWRLASIQPYSGALLQRTRLPDAGSVVIAEHRLVRLLQFKQQRLVHVSATVLTGDAVLSLAEWIRRERSLIGAQDSPCYWLAEPQHRSAQRMGRALTETLAQSMAGKLRLQSLAPTRALTGLWQESAHVA